MYTHPPLPVAISQRAEAMPDTTAIEYIPTAEQITWLEVDESCRRWAAALQRIGVQPGECVVTMMPNAPAAMYAWLGCSWLRAIEVPVNPDYRGAWLTHAINTSGARILVTSRDYAPVVAEVADALDHVAVVVVYDAEDDVPQHGIGPRYRVVFGEEFLGGVEPAEGLAPPQMWDTMSVLYTSGTTGPAKPVILPWGMQETQALLFSPPEFKDGTFYGSWPPFHMLGKSQLLVPIFGGGKLVFARPVQHRGLLGRRQEVRRDLGLHRQRRRQLPPRAATTTR